MNKGSDIYNETYHDQVGKLIFQLNQIKSWTKAKHLLSNKLLRLLDKNGYTYSSGNREEYRLHGGTGTSYIYKVPQNKRGVLMQFRGQYVRIVCVGTNRYVSIFGFKPIKKTIIESYLLTKKIVIVSSREGSGMTSTWREYLCLTYGDKSGYRIFEGRYKALGDKEEYYDEELEDFNLPESIDGELVSGIEDDYVVGGDLSYESEKEAVEFNHFGENNFHNWLSEMQWDHCIDSIKEAYLKFRYIS
jgi:hypothetical protein